MRLAPSLFLGQYGLPQGQSTGVQLVELAILVLSVAGLWRVFQKAGKPGWAAIIPIYNVIVLLQITGRPLWWIILYFIPFVNLVVLVLVSLELAKRFGKGVGFGIGIALLPFIFYPVLGFGPDRYLGAGAAPSPTPALR
jgi:hypothetical protein